MAKNEHLNVFFCPIYNETVKSKYFLYPHWVHQAQMGAVKALAFMHHFYVILLLFFLVKEQPLKSKLLEFYEHFNSIPRS